MKLLLEHASGIMVALYVPKDVAQTIAVKDGEPVEDLHVTLAYIPEIGEDQDKFNLMCQAMKEVADRNPPVVGHVGGIGKFNGSKSSDGKDVYYASFDAPGLVNLVKDVHDTLREAGFEMSDQHGFTPHITLKYIDKSEQVPVEKKESPDFTVNALSVASKSLDPKHLTFGGGSKVESADRLFESINDLAPEDSFGEGSEWDSEFCGDVAHMLRTEVATKFDIDPKVAFSSEDESEILALASRLKLRHISYEIVPEGHKFLLMVDKPDLGKANRTLGTR